MDKLKDLDAAEKEKLAENVRRLWVSEANLALVTSETDRREGKKLQRQSDKDEGDLVRLLAEIGVGRYSPEHQQMRNAVDAEVAVMLEDSRQMNAELDELHRPIRAKLTALENSLDDLRRQV